LNRAADGDDFAGAHPGGNVSGVGRKIHLPFLKSGRKTASNKLLDARMLGRLSVPHDQEQLSGE
jgi:hypothetical protein